MSVVVKSAEGVTEVKAAYGLVKELAQHENSTDFLKITEAAFVKAASGTSSHFKTLIAVQNDEIVGVATYFERFHIWNGSHLIELDDLFVRETARGLGIGTRLLTTLGAMAKAKGWPVKWQVNADNEGAIALYQRLGADYRESGICFWRPENI